MEYALNTIEWNDESRTSVRINAVQKDGEAEEEFYYVASETGHAPLNKILWAMAMEQKERIVDNEYERIVSGRQEVPDGYVVRDRRLISVAEEKIRVIGTINAELDNMYSGRAMALAETDPVYAENRRRRIARLLSLESRPDFPFVDLEEEAGEEIGEQESGGGG